MLNKILDILLNTRNSMLRVETSPKHKKINRHMKLLDRQIPQPIRNQLDLVIQEQIHPIRGKEYHLFIKCPSPLSPEAREFLVGFLHGRDECKNATDHTT